MIKKIVFLAVLGITHVASSQYAYNSSLFYQTPALFNVASVATGAEDFSFCTAFKMQNLTMSGTPMRTNALIGEFKISVIAGKGLGHLLGEECGFQVCPFFRLVTQEFVLYGQVTGF